MVTWFNGGWYLLLAEERQFDPDTRARMWGALGALILLGFLLVILAWLGARATRRYMHRSRDRTKKTGSSRADDWYEKPLPQPQSDELE